MAACGHSQFINPSSALSFRSLPIGPPNTLTLWPWLMSALIFIMPYRVSVESCYLRHSASSKHGQSLRSIEDCYLALRKLTCGTVGHFPCKLFVDEAGKTCGALPGQRELCRWLSRSAPSHCRPLLSGRPPPHNTTARCGHTLSCRFATIVIVTHNRIKGSGMQYPKCLDTSRRLKDVYTGSSVFVTQVICC